MLWDDVVDESTPEKLFFSRVFEWLTGTTRFSNSFSNDFHEFLLGEVHSQNGNLWMLATINKKEYKDYKRKAFYQTFLASQEMANLLDSFIKDVQEKTDNPMNVSYSYTSAEYADKYMDGKTDWVKRNLPTFSYFQKNICGIDLNEVLRYITNDDDKTGLRFNGNEFSTYLASVPIQKHQLAYRREKCDRNDKDESRQLDRLERELKETLKEIYRDNIRHVNTLQEKAGFPYKPTLSDYQRFIEKNIPDLIFVTSIGNAKIKSSDLLNMSLFELPCNKFEYLSTLEKHNKNQ